MSIFLEIAKRFISEELKKIQSESLAADESPVNTFLTFLSYGRDTQLSAEKRALIDELLPQIDGLEGNTDENTYTQMVQLIQGCRTKAAAISAEKQYDEGVFGQAMQNVVNLLQGIHDKIKKLELLNIPHNDDPLHVFFYFASVYCVNKVVKFHQRNLWERLIEHPKVTDTRKFSSKKEGLVCDALRSCKQEIEVLDRRHDLYQQSRKKRVLEGIQNLMLKNQALCQDVKVPLVGVNIPGAHPSYGYLEVCMKDAIDQIDPQPKEPLKLPNSEGDAGHPRRGLDASKRMPENGTSTPVSLTSIAEVESRTKEKRDLTFLPESRNVAEAITPDSSLSDSISSEIESKKEVKNGESLAVAEASRERDDEKELDRRVAPDIAVPEKEVKELESLAASESMQPLPPSVPLSTNSGTFFSNSSNPSAKTKKKKAGNPSTHVNAEDPALTSTYRPS